MRMGMCLMARIQLAMFFRNFKIKLVKVERIGCNCVILIWLHLGVNDYFKNYIF